MKTSNSQYSIVEEHGISLTEENSTFDVDEDEIPIVSEDFVCSVAESLEIGYKITINNKDIKFEVIKAEKKEEDGILDDSDYPYYIWWLNGNGKKYRLSWSSKRYYYPTLCPIDKLKTIEKYSPKYDETIVKTIISDDEGETVHWICPEKIERDNLSNWVLMRNIQYLEDS